MSDPLFDLIASIPDPTYRSAAMAGYPLPQLARFGQPPAVVTALGCLSRDSFDGVHAFRLYMAPFAAPFLGRAPSTLDLDDDDARTAASLASLAASSGQADEAGFHRIESGKWARYAGEWAPRFDVVSLAASHDATALRQSLRSGWVVCIPNAVDRPTALSPPPDAGPFTLLFVGTMGYQPNWDAAHLLAREVLPALRRRTASPVRVLLVGGPAGALRALEREDGVVVTGRVDDLRPIYAASHVALAPLRAGGGTRIKILEAMAHGRPVVATPLGAEGLAVEDGVHLLLGSDVEGLAEACLRLLSRPDLAGALVANGLGLIDRRYGRNRVLRQIARDLSRP